MKKLMLEIAGVKNEKEFYNKFPTEESFMAKHGKTFKKRCKAEGGENIAPYIGAATDVLQGLSMIKGQKDAVMEAKKNALITGVQAKAAASLPEQVERRYVRPEDMIVPLDAMTNPYGQGTEILAKKGARVPRAFDGWNTVFNSLNSKGVQDSIGMVKAGGKGQTWWDKAGGALDNEQGDQLVDSIGNLLNNGGRGPDAGSMIGGGIGNAAGTLLGGPLGGKIGELAGGFLGGMIDQSDNKIRRYQGQADRNVAMMMGSRAGMQSAFMEDGGITSLDGDLVVGRGRASTASLNPYTEGGETVIFNGPSHDKGGMPILFGQTPVEVEGGEPAMRSGQNLVVFGDIKINDNMAGMLGDPAARNKKFKSYVKEIAKNEAKQVDLMERSVSKASDYKGTDAMDDLAIRSLRANIKGADMKLQELARKKSNAARLQTEIHEIADYYDADPKTLAEKGVLKKAEHGGVIPIAKSGITTSGDKDKEKAYKAYLDRNDTVDSDRMRKSFEAEWQRGASGRREEYFEKLNERYMPLYKTFLRENNIPMSQVSYDYFVGNVMKRGVKSALSPRMAEFLEDWENGTKRERPWRWYYDKDYMSTRDMVPVDKGITKIQNDNPGKNVNNNTVLSGKGSGKGGSKKTTTAAAAPALGDMELMNYKGKKAIPARKDAVLTRDHLVDVEAHDDFLARTRDKFLPLEGGENYFDMAVRGVNSVLPYLRPGDRSYLDPRNIAGELYTLANERVEPVQAQTFQPLLASSYDISMADMLNENRASYRAAERLAGNNPAALASLNAQRYGADQKVLAEEFRQNQGMKMDTINRNREVLNQAQQFNLGILDNQMTRQEQAKSNTMENIRNAMGSIGSKYMQNQLENRTLGTYENMYNYRFDENGRAVNYNPLVTFNTTSEDNTTMNTPAPGRKPLYYEKDGNFYLYDTVPDKAGKKGKAANGALVKAFKNL